MVKVASCTGTKIAWKRGSFARKGGFLGCAFSSSVCLIAMSDFCLMGADREREVEARKAATDIHRSQS